MQTTTAAAADLDLTTAEGVSAALALMRTDNLPDDLIHEDDVFGALTFMPVGDLMALVGSAPYCPLLVAMAARLEWAQEEIDSLDDELREAKGLPRKPPGKVVDMRTRRTLA